MTTTVASAGLPARIGRGAGIGAAVALPAGFLVALLVCVVQVADRPELLATAGWTAGVLRAVLAGSGVPVGWYIGYWAFLELAVVVVTTAAAVAILRGTVSPFRLVLAVVLLLHATAGGAVLPVLGALHPGVEGVATILNGLAWFALFPLAYVFPDGRFVPGWTRWLLTGWAALFVVLLVGPAEPPVQVWLIVPMLLLLVSGVIAQFWRYLRVSGPAQRRQVKWVVLAVALRFAYMVAILLTPLGALMTEVSARGLAADVTLTSLSYAISALLPVAIAIAIVRHRLFDVDLVVSRTLVYGTLTVFVAAAYAIVVLGFGALWRGGGTLLTVLVTAVVAVAINPLRGWVQRRINRLVYGQRDEPYAVVSALGASLGAAVPPDVVLRTIVDTIGTALKLPYVSVTLHGEDGRTATFPDGAAIPAAGRPVEFPLAFHGDVIGLLRVAPAPGDSLGPADRALLADVSRQAGVAVRAASLTADLRAARGRTVAAREEERRRLHRDLHDGLGPTLASLYQRVDASAGLIGRDPHEAARMLGDVRDQIKETIAEIRRLVHSLRPPALDELGLVGAVEEAGRHLTVHAGHFVVEVEAPQVLPVLPAVVEVAAFRIAAEAMTNAVRHAGPATCRVLFRADASYLTVLVTDDGAGLPAVLNPGVGLQSMRERAEEIGGTVTISGREPTGTRVAARLPLSAGAYDQPKPGP